MKAYPTNAIRNLCIVAHAGGGKTTLIEAMLYSAGAIERMGRVEDGTTVSDFDPDEIARKTTLNATPCIAEWRETKLNLLDTPGYDDFYGDLECALRVSDAAIVLIDAVHGVQGGTEKVWEAVERRGIPRALVVARMDAEEANFENALHAVQTTFEVRPLLVQVPIGSGAHFRGVVDALRMRALDDRSEIPIPPELKDSLTQVREALVEAAAEGEEDLTEKYLEGEELTTDEIIRGLRTSFRERTCVPVLAVSGVKAMGVRALLDFVVDVFPSPADVPVSAVLNGEEVSLSADPEGPLAALVFKTITDPFAGRTNLFRVYSGTLRIEPVLNTTRNESERITKLAYPHGKQHLEASHIVAGDIGSTVKLSVTGTGHTLARADKPLVLPPIDFPPPTMTLAVFPQNEGDDDRLMATLLRIADEDPTFRVSRNNDTKETLISGLGDLHLTVSLEKAKRKYNANLRTATPKIAYRETLTKPVKLVEYTHKKQTGGAGQYGKVVIDVEPLPRGAGYEFVDKIFGGAIDQQFRPSVDKGVQAAMAEGVLAGFPVVDVRVSLVDGKTHPVDSKDIAFQTAGREAFRKAAELASPVLLEPIMNVEIRVPEDAMGDVIGDMNSRRGHVLGMEQNGRWQIIRAQVPLAEMARYHTDLRGLTRARGSFKMELSHYAEVPRDQQEKIIAQVKQG